MRSMVGDLPSSRKTLPLSRRLLRASCCGERPTALRSLCTSPVQDQRLVELKVEGSHVQVVSARPTGV
jgi:hypothetical protein